MKNLKLNLDDKDLVIIGTIVLALCSLWAPGDHADNIKMIITGLFGIAIGRK